MRAHAFVLAVTLGQPAMAAEPPRAPVNTDCQICLVTYIHNPAHPGGVEAIREECDFSPTTVASMRARQQQIVTEGTYSYRHWEDWGTWYGPHRIESAQPMLQPPCY